MMLFLNFMFTPAIALFSFLMILVLLYWLIFIMGAMDLDFLDFDFEVEAEGEIDANAMPDAGGVMAALLGFFYVGQIPVTILVTMLSFTMWIIAMIGNFYINPTGGFLLGLPIAAGTFVASLFVVKIVGYPIGLLFRALHSDADEKKTIVGGLCRVITGTVSDEMGQVEMRIENSQVTLNAVTKNGEELKLGDEAVVLEKDESRNLYIIVPVELENQNDE